MKSIFICVVWLMISNGFFANPLDLEYVREQYEVAVTDKNKCEAMITELRSNTYSDVHLAYLGAYQTIWAKHMSNPVNKFKTFNEGKKNIEKAIKQSGSNVEIRFVRLSVQKNCPAFLGYRDNITQDKQYLNTNKNTINSVALLRMINKMLSE